MARPKEKQEEEKKETGKKYLPVQSSAGTKGQTAQERAKEILSMSREEQKARNQARLREALNRSAQSRPASSAQTEAMRRNFTKREQKEEYRRRYGTPQSSREAREQYQWNKRQREAFEQYQSYFEKYGQKPTEEQVQNNPVLSDIGQLWKANTTQAQATQKALEEIGNTRVPSRAGRALFMAAQNANSIAPLEQARDRELPQLSQEDQAFVDNARKRLEELYPQRDALEAKGDAEGLAEVNRLIDNEEKVMRDRGVALPGEVAETVDKYALGGSKDLEAYLEAKRNVELMDEEIALGGVIAPEENKAYQDLKARVESGEELTGQDVYDYKVWSEQYGAYERDKETIKTLEEAGVLESGYSYAAQERQRVNEGQLTQIEALTQYAGTIQASIAKQEASKLLTELYNQQYALEKDIAAMQQAGAGDSIGDNLALKTSPLQNAQEELEAVKTAIAEAEYAMLRFEDDFFMNVQPGAGAGKKGSVYHVVNATEEELAKLRARGVGQSVMPVRSGVADAIAGLSGQELNALRMTDMERQTYNYLHNTKGAEAADAYFKSLEPRLLKRQAEMQQGVWQTMAEHPVGAFTTTAATFPMTLVEGLGAVKTGVDTMLGRETSPYDSAFAPTRFKSTVRDTVKAGQREAFGDGLGGDIANLAYDVVTTSLDSALSMAAGGATGGSALMALSATSGKTQQELLLGRDNSRALVQGLAAGVTEYITEKLGMDRLTAAFSLGKKGGYRTILANMIKGFVPEALEELPGNVVDRALDNYLNGDSSQRAESIKQKRAAGMSVTQATVETDMEFVVETLQGMLVGGLSGSLGAGVSTSVGMIKARSARTALTEAGVDADTAQAAAERISGLRSDAASEQAVRAAVEQMQQAEDAKGVKHTPFAAEATAAGYEDVPVKVTGFQGIRDGAAWVEIEIAGKGKGEIRLDQVRFADTDTQAAYNRAAMFEDTQTARRFLAGYENTSLPLEIYGQAFQSAYQAGQNSRAMTEYERKVGFGTMLEDGVYRIAYQAGQEATAAQNARLEIPESLGKTVQEQLGQLPRTYTEGYTGVVYAAKTTRPTKAQAVMLSLLDDYAKAHGVHYTVVDSIGDGGANGVYTTSEGMVVALDAEEGYLTRVATHEGWHYIREQMGQEAQDLQDVVLELLGNTEGYNLDSRVAEKQEQYKQIKGQELSREEALEELTADALYDAIATPEALGAFVSHAYENAENKNAFQQAMDQVMAFINRFVAEVKALAKKIAGKNPEARAMLEHEADWGESIIQEYNRLMEEAGKRERGRTERKETGETWYSKKNNKNSNKKTEQQNESGKDTGKENKKRPQNEYQQPAYTEEDVYAALYDILSHKDEGYDNLVRMGEMPRYFTRLLGMQGEFYLYRNHAYENMVSEEQAKEEGRYTGKGQHFHQIGLEKMHGALMGLEHPIMTIATQTSEGNPAVIMLLDEKGNNGAPLYAVFSFYAKRAINGDWSRRPHIVLSVYERDYFGTDARPGLMESVRNAVEQGRVLDFDTTKRESLSVIAKQARLGNITADSLAKSIAQFKKEINRFREENKINYSLRNVDTDMTEMQRVVEENEKLREAVGVLRAAMKQLSGAKAVNSRQVWKFAREIKKKYESKVRVNDLGENLRRVYDAMANARTDAEGKSAMEAMAAIARNMLENSEHINRDMYDRYADMRDYLRRGRFQLTEAQWAEAEKLYGSLKEFRNEVKGRWGVAGRKDHSTGSLDAAWEDMHAKWPEMFDRNADERGKVQQVVAALEAVQKEVSNPYGMNLDQMTQTVTAELFEGFGQVNEANALMEEAKAIARRKTTRWAINREKLAEQRKARAEVIRQKGRILKKLNSPKPGSFVPYQMREAVTALLEALDYNEGKGVTIKREMLERARQEYEAVLPKRDANGSAVPDTGIPALAAFYNGDVSEAMQRLAQSADGKQLNRLSQEETIELRDILRSYAAMILNEDRLFMQKRQDSLQEAGDGLVARMLQRKAHKQRGKAAETVLNVTNRALLSPGTVFHIFEGTEMEPIWKALRDAENTHTRHVAQGQAYMEAALKEYGVQEIINQSERKQLENGVEVTLHDGKKQKFRIQEAMYIYAAAKREKLVGTNHLLGGGIVFQKNSHPGEATGARQLTAEDLEAIAGKLTEKQKAFVDHMVQFLSRDTAEWGNQVTRELYGVEKFKESYYVPFKVARNYLRTDPASQQENRLKLGSFTKPLAQQASNPLEVQNFVEMWAAHMEQMSDYNAFVLPIEDMTRLMNYKTDNDTVRSVMQERYGNQVPDYILSFLRRLNGNAKSEMGSALVNKLVSGAKGAAVGGNLSVASQQATAVLRAYALIDAKYLVKGMGAGALSAAKMKKSYAEIMDWAPIATQKSWGYFDTNMTRGTYDRARQTAMGKLDDALGYLSQKGDELAFTMIWEAVKREVAAESGLTRGTEAYFRRCGERFTEVIDQTQVVDSIFQRTELATEKGLARLWTSFMSEPFKQYNMLWRAGWDLKEAWRSGNKAAIKRARNQMIRTSASVVLSSVAAAAAKSLISAMRDDDDEKKEKDENGKTVTVGVRGFGEKYWDAFLPNLLDNATGLLPLVGNWLGSFITGETYNSSSMDSALLDSITRMWQALGKGDYEMAWYRGLQVVSNATGLGLGNAYRDGKALFTTLVKTLQRDTLAGTAWDKSKPLATRLQAATKNYVYAKQEGDSRRASPAVFYDLLLDAWYAGGTGEEFQQVATAMLETGATVDGIASGFKSRLRGSEELVTKAADAYEQGKYSEYEKHVLELVRLGIGQKAAVSMVDSVLDSRKKATEEPEAQTWEMLLDELTDDDADLFSTKDLLEAIQRGDQAEADYLLGRLKESKEESTIRSGLTEAYRKEYVAAWEKGDTAAMKKISDLLLGLDVGYTEESIAKWPRDEMNADYREAIESGDAGQMRTVIAAMKKEGYTDSELRSKLTQDYKASYTEAWNAGNKTQAQSIAAMLKGLAVGYTEDSFKEWRVDSLKADWDAAVEARDVTRLKTQISRQMEAGVNQKQIRDKVWNAYGDAYVMALAEGNTSTARQLAGLMLNTGAGLTAEEVPQKAVNKAHSIYENSVESGDLNTARQVLKYLNQAEDGDRLWDKLYNWAKDAFMDAYDSGEYADLEKNLVSMGFSQKTINGWKD